MRQCSALELLLTTGVMFAMAAFWIALLRVGTGKQPGPNASNTRDKLGVFHDTWFVMRNFCASIVHLVSTKSLYRLASGPVLLRSNKTFLGMASGAEPAAKEDSIPEAKPEEDPEPQKSPSKRELKRVKKRFLCSSISPNILTHRYDVKPCVTLWR